MIIGTTSETVRVSDSHRQCPAAGAAVGRGCRAVHLALTTVIFSGILRLRKGRWTLDKQTTDKSTVIAPQENVNQDFL